MATVELSFSPLPGHVRTARLLAATVARRSGLDEATVDEVKLAVGEACARAVGIHGELAPDDDVVVAIGGEGGRFSVRVHDRGAPPDLDAASLDVLDLTAGSGAAGGDLPPLPPEFGLTVIAGLVDDMSVSAADNGTVVAMAWPIPSPAAAGAGG